MINESFKKSYEQIFEQVYPHIKNHRQGALRAVIYLILDESQAEEVCQEYIIKSNSSLDDEVEILVDILYTVFVDRQKMVRENSWLRALFELIKNQSKPIRQPVINRLISNEDKMKFIVLASIILMGLDFIKKRLRREKTISFSPTAICLAVPASAVSDLTVGNTIDRNEIIQLIDAASYFLCTKVEDTKKLSVDFNSEQNPSPDSQLKFYIRIDIPDGQSIIRQETKYVIKRDIPPNTQGQIKELGRLKSISSISSFNRI